MLSCMQFMSSMLKQEDVLDNVEHYRSYFFESEAAFLH